jgi:hypothetical protein
MDFLRLRNLGGPLTGLFGSAARNPMSWHLTNPQLRQEPSTCVKFNAGSRNAAVPEVRTSPWALPNGDSEAP